MTKATGKLRSLLTTASELPEEMKDQPVLSEAEYRQQERLAETRWSLCQHVLVFGLCSQGLAFFYYMDSEWELCSLVVLEAARRVYLAFYRYKSARTICPTTETS